MRIQFENSLTVDSFLPWYGENRNRIDHLLKTVGAVLIRNVAIENLSDFETTMDFISSGFLAYQDGNSPRTKLSSKVYTSTEYDADQYITLHNELSYSFRYPNRIYFCCTTPAAIGGETPIADCRKIFANMPKDISDEIRRKKITYIRNLHGGDGFGPSWQSTFETDSKSVVEQFCRDNDIRFVWKDGNALSLRQTRDGIIKHHQTQEMVWFNQIDQFHPCHMDKELYETLQLMYDSVHDLPTYVSFGDDTIISEDLVREVRRTIDAQTITQPWEKGDLLLLDNILTCHGRNPYKGSRKVLVSMS